MAIRRQDTERANELLAKMEAWDWPNLYESMARSMVRGIVLHLEGRSAEALPHLRAATRSDGEYFSEEHHRVSLVWLARAAYLAEDFSEVDDALARIEAVEAPRSHSWPRDMVELRRLRAADREYQADRERRERSGTDGS